jgi:hypothetical protein
MPPEFANCHTSQVFHEQSTSSEPWLNEERDMAYELDELQANRLAMCPLVCDHDVVRLDLDACGLLVQLLVDKFS